MASAGTPTSNPLSRIALESPPWLAVALSIGGRIAGAALAVYIAQDQSYDRTQVFAIGLAILAALSLAGMLQLPLGLGGFVPALAAGTLFFAGAVLLDQAAGVLMLIAGAAAFAGVLMANHRDGADPGRGIGAFFFGLGVVFALVWIVKFTVEG